MAGAIAWSALVCRRLLRAALAHRRRLGLGARRRRRRARLGQRRRAPPAQPQRDDEAHAANEYQEHADCDHAGEGA